MSNRDRSAIGLLMFCFTLGTYEMFWFLPGLLIMVWWVGPHEPLSESERGEQENPQ